MAPSSKYLTYKYPLWQGCTLQEIMVLCVVALLLIIIGLVMMPSMLGLPSWVGIILGGIVLKPLVKFLAGKTGEWKKNKPYGYLVTTWLLRLSHWGLIRLPYVRRVGTWRTDKRVFQKITLPTNQR